MGRPIYTNFLPAIIAAEHGLEMENALEKAGELYVDYNIFQENSVSKKKNSKHFHLHAGNQLNAF